MKYPFNITVIKFSNKTMVFEKIKNIQGKTDTDIDHKRIWCRNYCPR